MLGVPDEDEEVAMNPTRTCAKATRKMLSLATVVLYDHYESGCRAKAFLDQVAAKAGDGIQFSLALWPMDSLAYPDTNIGVFQDLGRSMMLVLALHAGREL